MDTSPNTAARLPSADPGVYAASPRMHPTTSPSTEISASRWLNTRECWVRPLNPRAKRANGAAHWAFTAPNHVITNPSSTPPPPPPWESYNLQGMIVVFHSQMTQSTKAELSQLEFRVEIYAMVRPFSQVLSNKGFIVQLTHRIEDWFKNEHVEDNSNNRILSNLDH